MFFIVDVIPMIKVLKILQGTCDTCHMIGEVKLIKSYQCLRLFFIPIFKWSIKYYLEPSCGTLIEIPETTAIQMLHGKLNLEKLHLEHLKQNSKVCSHCKQNLKEGFEFCPYCGYKCSAK